MPSLFHKARRSSEGIPEQPDMAGAGKLKGLFHPSEGGRLDTMKKRLSVTYKAATELGPPQSPTSASTSVFQDSSSPAPPTRIGNGMGNGEQWHPSYPLVVPDDESSVDIAPDGHVDGTVPALVSPVNENANRRSMELSSGANDIQYPILQPKQPIPAGKSLQNESQSSPTSSPAQTQILTPLTLTAELSDSSFPQMKSLVAPIATEMKSLSTPMTAPSPSHRPVMGSRKASIKVINSPPMPRPIANLPTLSGVPGFSFNAGSESRTPGPSRWTPGWAGLASPGPRTPNSGGTSTPRTPGFPFALAMTAATSANSKNRRSDISEEELRKVRRAMVSSCLRSLSDDRP